MKRVALSFASTFALALLAPTARAQETYDAVVVGVDAVGGGRGGAGTDDSVLGGGRAFVGGRFTAWRFGVEGGPMVSRTFQSVAVDVGAFGSYDFFSAWLDSHLSLAVFVRLDLLARIAPSVGNAGFLPEAAIGLRVFGFSIAFAGGPEIGLALAPGTTLALGGTGEARFGVDIVELVQLCHHISASHTPTPP